jgi:hypothetical protein
MVSNPIPTFSSPEEIGSYIKRETSRKIARKESQVSREYV